MDPTTARQVCRLIAGIVVSDDDLSPEEDAFVDKMLTHFDIPLEERDVVFPIIYSVDAADAMRAFPEEIRKEAFALLVQAAALDGVIAPDERGYLDAVREVVGVSEEALVRELDAALAARKPGS
jgi:uncharacterized tellurite resistance protein B-like protein